MGVAKKPLKDAYMECFGAPAIGVPERANLVATKIGKAIYRGYSDIEIPTTLTGTIPGSPPSPYGPALEIAKAGIYIENDIVAPLRKYEQLYQSKTTSAMEYATKETTLIADSIFSFFSTAQFIFPGPTGENPTQHTGKLTVTPPASSILVAAMKPQFYAVYSVIGRTVESVEQKADQLSAIIDKEMLAYFKQSIFAAKGEFLTPAKISLMGTVATVNFTS